MHDLTALRQREEDAGLLEIARRRGLRLVDLDAGLLDERRRDDEEDQQDEDAVDHRRDVDRGVGILFGVRVEA